MNNPFEVITARLDDLESLLIEINKNSKDDAPQSRIVSLQDFCALGFMTLSTAYLRLSKKGTGIPGAHRIGRLWFVDLDQFESAVKDGLLPSCIKH